VDSGWGVGGWGWTDGWLTNKRTEGRVGQEGGHWQERHVGQAGRVGKEGGQNWVALARTLPAGGVLETLVALNYGDPKNRG
jgi:hypothetical protein